MLKNRFLTVFVLAFVAGIAMPALLGTGWEAVSFLVGVLLTVLAVGGYGWAKFCKPARRELFLYGLLFAIGVLLGSGRLWVRSLPYAGYETFVGAEDTVEGIITESGSSEDSSYIELKAERSMAALPRGTKIRLYCEDDRVLQIGDRVGAVLTYGAVSDQSLRASSVALTANGSVTSAEDGEGWLAALRRTLLDACEALYDTYGVAGTAQALTLRERTLLSGGTADAYRNAGLAHLLAISGLHLSILIAALRKLLFAFGIRKQVREGVALAVIVLYCFLTGFSPSIVRAAIMLGFVLLGEIFLRDTDSLTMLAVALLVLLVANPYALLSIGLQLSFLSCLGLLLMGPYVEELQKKITGARKAKHRRIRRFCAGTVGSLLISCAAVVFTFPVTVFNFGTVAYLSPIANLIFVPLFTPVLSLLLLSVVTFPFLPTAAKVLAFLPGQTLRLMEELLHLLNERGIGSIETSSVGTVIPAAFALFAIVCVLVCNKHAFRLYVSFSVAFAVSLSVCVAVEHIRPDVTYLAVSQTEGYLFAYSDGTGTFLDLGSESAAYSLAEGYTVDYYILTDLDEISIARLDNALESGTVRGVYAPVIAENGGKNNLSSLKALANEKNCDIIEYHYVVQNETLLFESHTGLVQTSFGYTVLLYGTETPREDCEVILLNGYRGRLRGYVPDRLYVPLPLWTYDGLPDGEVNYYAQDIFFRNGKEVAP